MAILYRVDVGGDSGDEQVECFNDFCVWKLKEICLKVSNSNVSECVFLFKPLL
jgi:hypothetical protein